MRCCNVAISATCSSDYYLDVTHADANKGMVVLTLSKMLNIPTGQIATIGDMNTDVADVSQKRRKHRHGQCNRRRQGASDVRYEEQYGRRLCLRNRTFHPRRPAQAGR